MLVSIDPMDWRQVWIKTLEGAFIGVADLVQATGYRAKTQYEIAEEKRANAQLKRNSHKVEQILARTGTTLAAQPTSQVVIGGRVLSPTEALVKTKPPARADEGGVEADDVVRQLPAQRAIPRSERPAAENYREWLALDAAVRAGGPVSDADARWHKSYPNSAQYKAHVKKAAGRAA